MTHDEVAEKIMSAVFGGGARPGPHSLVEALHRGLVPREHLREAWEIVAALPYPRRPRTAIPARSLYNDPGWDDVVRALEEDR